MPSPPSETVPKSIAEGALKIAFAPSLPHYPWDDTQPAQGTWLTLRPGIQWVRMPLPFALNHINLWVLDDRLEGRDCWTVIDSGVHTEAIHEAWGTLWAGPMATRTLGRMLVTHMHPDHVGNAQWLIDRFSAPGAPARLWMSLGEYLAARISCDETMGHGGEESAHYFAAHGLPADQAARIAVRGGYYAVMVPSLPKAYRRLLDGAQVTIGERRWRCIAGFGHSPEHIALYSEHDHVLIAGDMLLPKISTNVSVTDLEPEGDALGLFLDSLARFESLPADTLVLPSHGLPFVGIHARVQALREHHKARLDELRALCATGPVCASDVLPVLFRRPLDLHQTTFAMGEAIAHLNHLWHRGELSRRMDDEGVWRFCQKSSQE